MEECLRSFEDLCPWKDVCALSSLAHNSTEIARKAERHKFTNSGSAKRMPPFFVLSFSYSLSLSCYIFFLFHRFIIYFSIFFSIYFSLLPCKLAFFPLYPFSFSLSLLCLSSLSLTHWFTLLVHSRFSHLVPN